MMDYPCRQIPKRWIRAPGKVRWICFLPLGALFLVSGCLHLTITPGEPSKINIQAISTGSGTTERSLPAAGAEGKSPGDLATTGKTGSTVNIGVSATTTVQPETRPEPTVVTVTPVISPTFTLPADRLSPEEIRSLVRESADRVAEAMKPQGAGTDAGLDKITQAIQQLSGEVAGLGKKIDGVAAALTPKPDPKPSGKDGATEYSFLLAAAAYAIGLVLAHQLRRFSTNPWHEKMPLWVFAALAVLAVLAALGAGWWLGLMTAAAAMCWMLFMLWKLAQYGDLCWEFKDFASKDPQRANKVFLEMKAIWDCLPGMRCCLGLSVLLMAINFIGFAACWTDLEKNPQDSAYSALYDSFENGIFVNTPEFMTKSPGAESPVAKWLVFAQHLNSIVLLIWVLPVIGARLTNYEAPENVSSSMSTGHK